MSILQQPFSKFRDRDPQIERRTEFYLSTAPLWLNILHQLFGNSIPTRYEWFNLHDICKTLNVIGAMKDNSHVFFMSGGLDLSDTSTVISPSLLSLGCVQGENIIKPYSLVFNKLDDNPEWNYFVLNCKDINTDEVYSEVNVSDEDVCIEKGTILIFMKASTVNFYLHDYCGNLNKLDEEILKKYLSSYI